MRPGLIRTGRSAMQRRQRHGGRGGSANASLIGTEVSVIQKQDQRTGRLTKGIVSEILTNSASHPRGIKVRLANGIVGRISSSTSQNVTRRSTHSAAFMDPTPALSGSQAPSLADFMTPVQSTSSITHESEWACPACTFVNSGLLPECELCQTARP